MTESDVASHIRIERFHLAVRMNLLQFPLAEDEVRSVLEDAGYVWSADRTALLAGIPAAMRVVPSGMVARSEDRECTFTLSPERGVLALQGREIERVIGDFSKIQEGIKDRYIPDWESKAFFYEFLLDANFKVSPERDPIKEMQELHKGSGVFEKLQEALGVPVTTYGLRLAEKGVSPDGPHWLEYKVEPDVGKPRTDYLVNIIYRDDSLQTVIQECRQALEKTERILGILRDER